MNLKIHKVQQVWKIIQEHLIKDKFCNNASRSSWFWPGHEIPQGQLHFNPERDMDTRIMKEGTRREGDNKNHNTFASSIQPKESLGFFTSQVLLKLLCNSIGKAGLTINA